MSVEFKDYYKILGVGKSATSDEIKKAFRGLARTCHPDLAKAGHKASAEAKFKEINEAYEVLRDPEKRAKYDQLQSDWKRYSNTGYERGQTACEQAWGSGQGFEYHFGGTGFSDFFERFFGGLSGDPFAEAGVGRESFRPGREQGRRPVRGKDLEADLLVTLEESLKGATRRISLAKRDPHTGVERKETLEVNIPAGVREGQKIRLAGQGHPSPAGGEPGDLFLTARFAQHPFFRVKEKDLHYALKLAPWEAALGRTVVVPTLRGSVKLQVKPCTQNGQWLRLAGQGLPGGAGKSGDLIVEVSIAIPKELTDEERRLWKQMAGASRFNPREE